MKTFSLSNRLAVVLLAGALASPLAFAQGVFEGSGEVNDPNCVGDGCGYVPAPNKTSSTAKIQKYPPPNLLLASRYPQIASFPTVPPIPPRWRW